MEFWKEPDGSFLWINQQGRIVDWNIKEGGRLYPNEGIAYLKLDGGDVRLGGMFEPIQNREKLLVDRKDSGNRFRDWCEKPKTAYYSLARTVFTPSLELEFFRRSKPDLKYPGADPFKGYDYFVMIEILLPCFMEGRSRVCVELWEMIDGMPALTYDRRIALATGGNNGFKQLNILWPLASVYQRFADVTIKVRLDLYGDNRLCLPLSKKGTSGGKDDWIMKQRRIERKPVFSNPFYTGYKKMD